MAGLLEGLWDSDETAYQAIDAGNNSWAEADTVQRLGQAKEYLLFAWVRVGVQSGLKVC